MRLLITVFILCAHLLSGVMAQNRPEGDICGYWFTEEEEAIIAIDAHEDGSFFGKIVWLIPPHEIDKESPNYGIPQKDVASGESILNLTILYDLTTKDGKKWKGRVYDPRKGSCHRCKIELSEAKDLLYLRGYIGISLIGRTITWRRASHIPPERD
ncbi:MAG: hypothetical protein CSA95_07945 [Bacteroidetes bacterium]|nr:MAG: hypothetical protein CSA95_07945 [Bacteroidota bacterium]PIE88224.1 MAG: hypothetical protein CSA04_03065 [Bacteroidota bacterium]